MKFIYSISVGALFIFMVSCASTNSKFHPTKKYSPQVLRNDLSLLKRILEANHPSLYWYTSKDSVDGYFSSALSSITDSLTELQFRNKVSWVVSKIHCGHTAVRVSKAYSKYFIKRRSPQFPLQLKIWDDSLVVISNALLKDSILKRGTIITDINGRSNRYLIDSMFQLISTDGYSNIFKQQLISFYFPVYYRNTFGLDSQYVIRYIDSLGQERTTAIKNFVPKTDSLKKKQVEPPPRLTKKETRKYERMAKRSIAIDTPLNTALLRINTFSGGRLQGFFKRSFRMINDDSIKNVVIDLRENTGGDIMSSTRLVQYLIDHPFHIADTVAAINRSFPYRQYISPWFIYWLSMRFTGRRENDGRIHFRYFERHAFHPKKRNHFNGNIYVVTSGLTFSAAALVAGALKGQKNVTVVGEETGGGSYGNTAMHLPVVTLPHTKLRLVLPLYRLVLDKDRPKTGRGIFPDVEVKPSSAAIKKGIDAKLEKVKELIRKRGDNTVL